MKKRDIWIAMILTFVGIIVPFAANICGGFILEKFNPFQYFGENTFSVFFASLLPTLAAVFSFWVLAKRLPFPFSVIPALIGYFRLFLVHFNFAFPVYKEGEYQCPMEGLGNIFFYPIVVTIYITVPFLLMLLLSVILKKWKEKKNPDFYATFFLSGIYITALFVCWFAWAFRNHTANTFPVCGLIATFFYLTAPFLLIILLIVILKERKNDKSSDLT